MTKHDLPVAIMDHDDEDRVYQINWLTYESSFVIYYYNNYYKGRRLMYVVGKTEHDTVLDIHDRLNSPRYSAITEEEWQQLKRQIRHLN
jgi:hypothetical protein